MRPWIHLLHVQDLAASCCLVGPRSMLLRASLGSSTVIGSIQSEHPSSAVFPSTVVHESNGDVMADD
ncbi:hypothetical protein GN244_ATG17538 [Phytophthora infestans]|uniref:Uncharacterized protein n=1 Tax=Phytophthora infestans TaxID=4787 RepID=A0A833WED3_PHYIN|nr:hypothetical protein GN244_ATG17538 [Phytophthora infestans]